MEVIHKGIVDDQHDEVQSLLNMGVNISKDDCISAIQKWETADEALAHLLQGGEGGLFELQAQAHADGVPLHFQPNLLVYT